MRLTRLLCVCLLAGAVCLAAESAGSLFKKGQAAEKKGNVAQAYLLYSRAAATDPANPIYWAHAQAVQRIALESGALKVDLGDAGADAAAPESSTGDTTADKEKEQLPDIPLSITREDIAEARRYRPPPDLKPLDVRKDIRLRGNAKTLWEQVAKLYGLDVVFDGDYKEGQPSEFRLENASYVDAIRGLEASTWSFVVPLSEKLMLVVEDTPAKRTQVEPTATVLIPLPEAVTVQEVQEIARAVQSALDIKRVAINTQKGVVLLRDRVSHIDVAEAMFKSLLYFRSQVVVDVQILSVSASSTLHYGISLQSMFPVVNLANRLVFSNATTFPTGFLNFATFGGGKTLFGVGLADAELFASMTKSQARVLYDSQVRALSGEAATVIFGERFPIATNLYLGDTSGTGQVYTPPPTVNFENLGLNLKITPQVHGVGDVSLAIEAQFRLLSGQSYNSIPVVNNRELKTTVRLIGSEWAVIAGVESDSTSKTWNGLPLLSRVPFLRENNATTRNDQLLIVLKPHIVNYPPQQLSSETFYTGSESRPSGGL